MTRRDGADAFRTTATPVLVTSVLVCALGCSSLHQDSIMRPEDDPMREF
jgi:hypothetical protein